MCNTDNINLGVLLTTSIAYYTSQEFKRSQEFVSKTLKDTEAIIQNRGKEPQPVPRSVEFQYRPSIKQTVADLWNDQILSGVKSIYTFDAEKYLAPVSKSIQDGINNISK